jgi:hypothetical protein
MATTRTKSLTTIAILLIVLAVLSITSAVTMRIGFAGGRPQRDPNGNTAPGGNFQGGNGGGGGNFQGGNGGGGGFQGGNGGGGNFQGRAGSGGFNLFGATRSLGISPQVFGYINIGIMVIGILLLLLCAYGVWKQKRWALNLAIVVALLFLLGALPGLFFGGGRFFNVLRTAITILDVVASVAIIVMGILPSVRDSVS